ncbi:MAG: trigger factor [Acidimicrobiia bacterium]|nr:trigger factor [Acidimicrobiia bacterium]
MTEVGEPNPAERLLTITVDAAAFEAAKARAARRLSREVKVKGFRPGKAPQRLVESVVGPETMRREAVDEALPVAVSAAVEEAGLEPAVTPRVTAVRDTADGFEADVRVTLWPEITGLPEYRGRRMVVDSPAVSDGDVEAHIERMRLRFAELEDVARPGDDGDFSLIDVRTRSGDAEVAAGSATDLLVEVGSGGFLEGLGEALRGKQAGDIVEFSTTLPKGMGDEGGKAVDARVLVKQVKARRLPELTDEWVDEVSEFSSVAEMRSALGEELRRLRLGAARVEFEERLLDQLRDELDLQLPADLIDAEADAVLHRFAHRLEARKVTIEQYLAATGQSAEMLVADARSQAVLNLRTRLLLEAVARAEGIEVSDEDLEGAINALAAEAGMAPAAYKRALAEGGGGKVLAGDILRRRAVDRLLELAVAVDADGQEIEFPALDAGTAASGPGGEAAESDEQDDPAEPTEVES